MNASGALALYHAAVFDNQSGATYNLQNDSYIDSAYSGFHFDNAGTFTKSGGTGTSLVYPTFNNSGVVNANSGTIAFNGGGTSSGTYNVPATLQFNGGAFSLTSSSSVAGAGTVNFSGGTMTLGGTYNITGGTTVSGTTVTVTGTIANVGPTMTVSGGQFTLPTTQTVTTINLSGGTLTMDAAQTLTSYTQTGGTLAGTAAITVTGSVSLTYGVMAGDTTGASTVGDFIINPGVTGTLSAGTLYVDGR